MPIHFFSEETLYKPQQPQQIRSWIKTIVDREKRKLKSLNFIFCNDDYLLNINRQYLNHHTYTDIITFDNSEDADIIEGEIYISVERVENNAVSLNLPFKEEMHRVIIHGVLHLLGFKDKTKEEKHAMREKETACLSLLV